MCHPPLVMPLSMEEIEDRLSGEKKKYQFNSSSAGRPSGGDDSVCTCIHVLVCVQCTWGSGQSWDVLYRILILCPTYKHC